MLKGTLKIEKEGIGREENEVNVGIEEAAEEIEEVSEETGEIGETEESVGKEGIGVMEIEEEETENKITNPKKRKFMLTRLQGKLLPIKSNASKKLSKKNKVQI